MKKIVKITALCLTLACLMSVSAFAAGTVDKGIVTPITAQSGITVTVGAGNTGTIGSTTVTDTETLTLSYPGAVNGAQYVVFLLSGEGAPTESNIAYIDQKAATASGVSFTIFPKELKAGVYRLILTSSNDSNVSFNTPVATIEYKQAYTLGDVNSSGVVDATDALVALQHAAELCTLTGNAFLAADVNASGAVDATDALMILQYAAEMITGF